MKLMINCGTCDARNVSEETLKAYEQITVNCGSVMVTPETKELLSRYSVNLNCGDVLELGKDVLVSSVNGRAEIKPTDLVPKKTYLKVNGSLEIAPGAEKVLEQYVGIGVNGMVQYPESMSAYLGKLKVNGAANCYPDGAIVLKSSAVIDKTFLLRARKRLYWSAKRMVMVDPELDGGALAGKGATFSAKEVILSEDKVESLLDCIDEKAELILVPQGTGVILDDVELGEGTAKRYGRKLCVMGDVEISKEDGGVLAEMEYLNIHGDVSVPAQWKDLLLEKAEISGDVSVIKGRVLKDRPMLKITRQLLEQEPEGIHVEDCMTVRLEEDIPQDLILDRLTIRDCMKVLCGPDQEGAVSMICEDVMKIGADEGEDGIGGVIRNVLGGAKAVLNTRVINAGDYVL